MPTVNVSFQVIPNVPEERIYPVVDKVIALIQASGIKHEVGPMETTMEGDLAEIMALIVEAQEVCTREGASRIASVVKIDYKPGGVTIHEKISKYRA